MVVAYSHLGIPPAVATEAARRMCGPGLIAGGCIPALGNPTEHRGSDLIPHGIQLTTTASRCTIYVARANTALGECGLPCGLGGQRSDAWATSTQAMPTYLRRSPYNLREQHNSTRSDSTNRIILQDHEPLA